MHTIDMAPVASRPLRGIVLVLAAVFIFAGMDATSKFLVARYAVPLVLTARYLVNLILVVAVFAPREGAALFAINRKSLVWLRALSLAFASLFAGHVPQAIHGVIRAPLLR